MLWQSERASTLLFILGLFTVVVFVLYYWAARGQNQHRLKISSWRENPQAKWHLALAGGLYVFVSILYLFAIPVGESPDEPGHLRCIEQVAIHNQIPVVDPKPEPGLRWWQNVTSGGICYHLPLYYLLGGQIYGGVAALTGTPVHFEFPPINPNGPSPNMFQQADKTSFWLIPEPVHLVVLRVFGILLGFVTLFTSYVLAWVIFPKEPMIAFTASLLVAGWPQFVYLTRGISNDVLATALGSLVLLFLIDVGSPFRLILAAYVSTLAVLAKLTLVFVPVVVLLVVLTEWLLFKDKRAQYQKVLLINIVVWGMAGLLLLLNPILKQHFLSSGDAFSTVSEAVYTLVYWLDVTQLGLSTGWAYFGWLSVPAPLSHAYIWWGLLTIAAGVGFIYAWDKTAVEKRPLLMSIALWLAGALLVFIKININRFQPQFRFILVTVPLWTTFAAGGIGWLLVNRKRAHQAFALCLTIVLVVYNMWLVYALLGPAYG